MTSREDFVRSAFRVATAAAAMMLLTTISSADRMHEPLVPAVSEQTVSAPAQEAGPPVVPPYAIVVNNTEVEGIVGKQVRSIADENMGRIIEIVVDGFGRVRAAVIDFGGFLGVGNRQVAVDWNLLQFDPSRNSQAGIVVKLTADQVRSAPEYKKGKAVTILGALGDPPVSPYTHSAGEW
jgi:hypothetical protein